MSERNPDAFRALIDQLDQASFAHLLCHWACTVHGYLLCELVCSPEPVPRVPLVEALAEVGPVLRALRADPQAFSAAASAVLTTTATASGPRSPRWASLTSAKSFASGSALDPA